MKISELLTALSLPPLVLCLAIMCTAGCENKEKVLDVEGPRGGNVEIERDRDTGEVEVDVQSGEEKAVDVDVPGADVEVSRDEETGDVEVE